MTTGHAVVPATLGPVRAIAAILVLAMFIAGAGVAAIAGSALIVYVPYAAVGAILVFRRPGNPIGWLLVAIGWVFAPAWLPVEATPEELASGTGPTIVLVVAWFKWWWSLPLALTLIAALTLTFPSGHVPTSRWRRPAQLLLAAMGMLTTLAALWPAQEIVPGEDGALFWMPNPVSLLPANALAAGAGTIAATIAPTMFVMLLAAIGSMLVRFRRSRGTERLQMRWLVAGLGSIVLAIPFGFLLLTVFGPGFALAWLPATIAFALPPIAIGIAVLRYRLYEIDRIISRTIGWAVVTGVLVALVASGVLALQALLSDVTQGQTLAVAASTLVAAAVFQPLRRRVQHAVDRRFDRARYDGERTVEAFATEIRNEVDLPRLRAALALTAEGAVRPAAAAVWLRVPPVASR